MGFSRNSLCYMGLIILVVVSVWQSVEAFGTFGFDIHHRYSDPVKGILDIDGLPEKGSLEYYSAMAHRDRFIRGRGARELAEAGDLTPLAFDGGNETYRISGLGFLHYANVSVGTPSLSFLVALDTGSDLFWLPCDCSSCVRGLRLRSGEQIDFNIYRPNASSTSMSVPCNSSLCGRQRRQCSLSRNACAYQVLYLSNNTSSTGILVEDTLHLITDDNQVKDADAKITFGCGIRQTGSFLDGAAPNGLFGLGMDNISVPSVLASQGLAANSFSMCFGPDGLGRLVFGDKGTSDQRKTPFHIEALHPTYNISVTQIIVEKNVADLSFTAIFDTGTSFTYLNDPAYTVITASFNSAVQERRHQPDSEIPFEYCYDLGANQTSFLVPDVNLTLDGGSQFYVTDPIITFSDQGGGRVFCLGVVKSGDINIIGQNFMTGYRIVFDRENMVLGWKESDCYDARASNTLPVSPPNTSSSAPPTAMMVPEATWRNGSGSPFPSAAPPQLAGSDTPCLRSFAYTLVMVIFSISIHYLIILSS